MVMGPITFAIWGLMGLLAGLLAGFLMKRGGQGRGGDVLLGLVGSLGAGGFCWAVGVSEMVAVAVVTFVGAAMSIALQRWLWPAGPRPGTPARPVWGVER
jgi:uncharacterized membrane protein YeaQ/YmgE (transglycosylase-associated protein family)